MSKFTNNLSVNDFKETCRTCLGRGIMFSLTEKCFGISLIEMLKSVTFVKFSDDNNLPLQICLKCKNNVTKSYSFAEQCLLADSKLQECLKNSQTHTFRTYSNPGRTESILEKELKTSQTRTFRTYSNLNRKESNLEQNTKVIKDNSENQLKTVIKIEEDSDEVINFETVVVKSENMSENEDENEVSSNNNVNQNNCAMESESVPQNNDENFLKFSESNLNSDTNMEEENSDSESDSLLKVDEKLLYNEKEPQMSESESESLPSDIEGTADNVVASLPEKSRELYEQSYVKFEKWSKEKGINNKTSEKVLLAYFEHLSKLYKPSSLWVRYSMLRSMLLLQRNIDIKKYVHLTAFLKRQSKGFRPKKSNVLRKEDVTKFLQDADDRDYLMMKVALIVGLTGACRREELTYLQMQNVVDQGDCIHIIIPNSKTKTSRAFFITNGNIDGINMVEIVRKYISLRPKNVECGRFFITYRNGKCVKQPVGVNTFGKMPKTIAAFLNLANPEQYTGHCFRRSSASLGGTAGGVRAGSWRSTRTEERYIDNPTCKIQ